MWAGGAFQAGITGRAREDGRTDGTRTGSASCTTGRPGSTLMPCASLTNHHRRAPAPQRRVPRPWDPPQTEFPGILPINTLQFGRSEQAALAITGMSAYSNGFEISVTALIHPGALASTRRRQTAACSPTSPYQIRLQLADGRTVAS